MDPVSFLQLFCNQSGYRIDFTLISEHPPLGNMFVYRCDLENLSSIGKALHKKRAKQLSARMMLCDMIDKQMFHYSDMNRANEVLEADLARDERNAECMEQVKDMDKRYINKLVAVCSKKEWSAPVFTEEPSKGKAHERIFYFNCQIANIGKKTTGEGKSKKMAKRLSAKAMLEFIEESGDKLQQVDPSFQKDGGDMVNETMNKTINQQSMFKKMLFTNRVTKVYEELSKNKAIISCLNDLKKRCKIPSDSLEFSPNSLMQLGTCEMSDILKSLAELGQFLIKTSFSINDSANKNDPKVHICTVSLIKDGIMFYAWYGKSTDKEEATKLAIGFTLKSFMQEIFVLLT